MCLPFIRYKRILVRNDPNSSNMHFSFNLQYQAVQSITKTMKPLPDRMTLIKL